MFSVCDRKLFQTCPGSQGGTFVWQTRNLLGSTNKSQPCFTLKEAQRSAFCTWSSTGAGSKIQGGTGAEEAEGAEKR